MALVVHLHGGVGLEKVTEEGAGFGALVTQAAGHQGQLEVIYRALNAYGQGSLY